MQFDSGLAKAPRAGHAQSLAPRSPASRRPGAPDSDLRFSDRPSRLVADLLGSVPAGNLVRGNTLARDEARAAQTSVVSRTLSRIFRPTGDTVLDSRIGDTGEFAFSERRVITKIGINERKSPVRVGGRTISSAAPGGWAGTTITFDRRGAGGDTAPSCAHRGLERTGEGCAKVTTGWGTTSSACNGIWSPERARPAGMLICPALPGYSSPSMACSSPRQPGCVGSTQGTSSGASTGSMSRLMATA